MGVSGYLLQAQVDTEVVCAYAAALQKVPAVAAAPGWFVCGSFFMPKNAAVRLEVIASVSNAALVGTARLYDPSTGVEAPVSGSDVAFTSSTGGALSRSGAFALEGNKVYYVLAQVVGAAGPDKFGTVETASLAGP